ncbi:MAG: sulfotransferase domain-containing protein [Gomphosphaeria aponina SAG 52.96 = DSM 107014]|uniref:Sulfotransferase domain-containing protein n=1 Tax=Gomphosphaeria aponina SAG 52.96 = DSM 107014 TaxID=1521640 RepID=A0A941JMH8_9CHRO|nr:sulfotransferase domain-containing protein [Gomphosphaeria aponina SAG 52.96 = DSM 107014]
MESLVSEKENPFVDTENKKIIVHCCYHKVGTVWFRKLLGRIGREYGLNFQVEKGRRPYKIKEQTEIFMQSHSNVEPSKLPPYRGSHVVRDPRDVVISGYFYHLWTKESWVHKPKKKYGGISYQEYLKSVDKETGLMEEIKRAATKYIKDMGQWNYKNPNFIEVKYEDLIRDEQSVFTKIFNHYGFNEKAIEKSLEIAEQLSFQNVARRKLGETKEKSHLRSGQPGEWQYIFNEQHKGYFKQMCGKVLVKLGYEKNNDW